MIKRRIKYFAKRKIVLLLLIIFLLSNSTYSNSGIFTRIGIDQGIAPGNVNDIIQDSLGFIWLATESGLCRYDGYKFKIYQNDPSDSSSLSYNNVFSLLKGENGIIWVGTLGGGLNKFDTKTDEFISYRNVPGDKNSLSHDIIFQVYSDSKGQIWVSTLGGGLNLFDPETEQFKRFLHSENDPNSISSNMASAIYEYAPNQLLIGTFDGGLNLLKENNTFTHFRQSDNDQFGINHNQVMDIIQYDNDELLVATFGGGINILNIQTMKFRNYINSDNFIFKTDHLNIRKLFDDGLNIWIGSYNGLYRYNKSNREIIKFFYDFDNPNTINNNKIREIYEDDSEVIWIGTTQGLNLFDQNRKKFSFQSYDDFITKSSVSKTTLNLPNTQRIMWPRISSQTDLQKLSEISFVANSKPSEKTINTSTYVNFYMNCDNILWFGDYNGLKYYDKISKEFRYIEYFDNTNGFIGRDFIKSFYIDSDENFWAGTLGGGLTYYNLKTKEFKKYIHIENDSSSIIDSRIIPILEDSYGILWVGTYGGLNVFDRESETFIRYVNDTHDRKSISNNRIYSIYESADRTLWIGTYQGLNKYVRDKDSFEHITTIDGLADNTVYTIQEDDDGNLWIRTNKGISKYNPISSEIKNYTVSDGLVGMEYESNISFKDDDGKLYFSGLNGFNSFNPNNIHDNQILPKVVFTDLRILDNPAKVGDDYLPKSLNEIDELVLSYKDKVFTIEFASLHFAISSKNQYAYMLEGFRDEWTYVDGDNRQVSFTNLNPGEYVLHVIASNNDGFWNREGRSLKIIVTPPYWETWWFQLIVAASILLTIFAFYEYRLHRLLEVERTRSRIARNLHDDVGGTLASIQYFVNAIRKDPGEQNRNKFLDLIMASSNDAQEKIRDIIWTVNPREDKLSKFLVKFNRYASDLFDSNGISYSITFPKIESDKNISMEKRQHLWCICKETVINTVKHSKCKNVNITFKINSNEMVYNIQDDGVGFDKNKQSYGNGLTNIIFRADKLKADYNITTSVDGGMSFFLSLDL